MRMRLIFALPGFHRYERGAEVALLAVAEELARRGEDVTVAGSGPADSKASYRYVEVPSIRRERFERFPSFPPFRSETAWEDATFALNLLRRVPLAGYDASLTCSYPFTQWALRRLGPKGPANIFITQNGDWPAVCNAREFRWFSCDGLVCTNPDYYARNSRKWHSALIPNGVDLGRFKPEKADSGWLGLPSGKPIILMVSALIESKRVLEGVRAVAPLEASLVVAGDGPMRQEVADLAGQLLPGRFRRISLPKERMPELYRSADVFLHLSLLESFGNVFLEAWASGLPIVGHKTDRLEWILGDSHFLADTTNPVELRSALMAALSAGRARIPEGIARYSWSTIGSEYQAFCNEVIELRQFESWRK